MLAEWLQIVAIISAGGGATERVLKILEVFAGEQFQRTQQFLIQEKYLEPNAQAAFEQYIIALSPSRRDIYDQAFRANQNIGDVAAAALPYLATQPISQEDEQMAIAALGSILEVVLLDSIARLKKVI